ncbi:hypothetical protein L9F63_021135 [Diploptera punctata]|uniref:C2H2-type domain-containing protein n=1 Tax=Diploptera punctata TaxID=6984 RepID=A0AAD7ZPN6_DIPPU|nr:hypothetical protein L9F63_021135 [Diploptera punctata]
MKKVTLETVKKVRRQESGKCVPHCFICDEEIAGPGVPLLMSHTSYTKTGLPNKIGQLMGDGFMVVVSIEDMLCKRCGALLNHLDKLESDLDIVRRALTGYLKMKYGLLEDTQQIQKVKDLMGNKQLQEISTPVPDDVTADIEYVLSDDSHENEVEPLYTQNDNKKTVEILVNEAPRNTAENQNKDIKVTTQVKSSKSYKCTRCDFKTTEVSSFHSHVAACSELPFKCTICERRFESHKYVRNHIMEAHLSNWTCHFCNKNFREEKEFTSHMKIHLGHNSTISKIQVDDSVSVSSNEDVVCYSPHNMLGNFECNICDYQCTNKKIFDDHVRKHVVLKLFQCKVCKERFQHKHELVQHVQEHKMQIFKCEKCSSEFDEKDVYVEHLQMHEVSNSKSDTLEKLVNENNITLETVLNQTPECLAIKSETACLENKNNIEFHTCQICSLTFVNLARFLEHAKMHQQSELGNEEVFPRVSNQLLQVDKVNLDEDSNGHDINSIDSDGRQQYVDMDESLEYMFEKLHSETEKTVTDKQADVNTLNLSKCNVCGQEFVNGEELQLHRVTQMHLESVASCEPDKMNMLVEDKSHILAADKFVVDCKMEPSLSFSNAKSVNPVITDSEMCETHQVVKEMEKHVTINLKDHEETQSEKDGFIDIFDMVREKKLSCNDKVEIDHNLLETMCEAPVKIESNDNEMEPINIICNASDLMQNELDDSPLGSGHSKKTYVCAICGYRTPSISELKAHFKEHKKTSFQCNVCGKLVPTFQKLATHKKSHEKIRVKMTCPYCYQEFSDKYRLQQHLQEKHQKEKVMYKCCFCNETFNTKKAYKTHEEMHPEDSHLKKQLVDHKDIAHRDPHCRFCGKEITKAKTLRNHELRHIREKDSFECDICKRVFKTKTGLRHHVAVHTGEYKYCCDYCGRGFMSRMMMEEHLSMHTKEERYICDVCGRKFSFQSTYWIHRKWHDNPYPYKCNYCGRKFRHSSLLAVHKRKHTGERPYKCPHCPLTFPVGGTLKRHLILHTGVYPFNCESCKRGFTTRHKYATHLAKIHGDFEMLHAKPQQGEFKMVIREDVKSTQPPTIWEVADDSVNDQMNFKLETIADEDESSKDGVGDGIACTIVSDDMLVNNVVPTRVVEIVLDETSQAVATVTVAQHADILPEIWYQ